MTTLSTPIRKPAAGKRACDLRAARCVTLRIVGVTGEPSVQKSFWSAFFTFVFIAPVIAQEAELAEALAPAVKQAMDAGMIPSLTIALVAGEEVVYKGGFGYSNIWAQTEARPETVYLIGSTYKAISMTGLLQLMEQGKFQLDDPVSQYIDFEIQGEHPENPITFRHLLTHTSGLPSGFGGHPVWGDTVPKPLKEYLAETLKVRGAPLRETVYSNPAYTLVAYLIEKISGTPYKMYMQRNVFDPLGDARLRDPSASGHVRADGGAVLV
jgi:CubicO group peptidase (beta-lactamase class C family)